MGKNKYLEFTTLMAAVILTRAADIIGTYYYTPNLGAEMNPMVKLFGLRWIGLLFIQILGISFIGFINYLSLFKTDVTKIDDKGLNFHEFLSMLYFNQINPWKWHYVYKTGLYGKDQSLNMYGWLIPRIFIYVGLILMFFFGLLDFIPTYREIHKFLVIPMYLFIFSSLPVCFYWYHKLRFEKYKSSYSL